MKGFKITDARVFVTTAAKYRNGVQTGEWLELIFYDDADGFYNACRELHGNERNPRFIIIDFENLPSGLLEDHPIAGYRLADSFFTAREALVDLLERETYPFSLWCKKWGCDLAISNTAALIGDFRRDYMGRFATEESFARTLVQRRDDLSEFALRYFDYAFFAEDMFTTRYWMECGHVFAISYPYYYLH